jgi:hypothetical protein
MNKIIVPDNNSFVIAARQMYKRGELTLEQYSSVLRRGSNLRVQNV